MTVNSWPSAAVLMAAIASLSVLAYAGKLDMAHGLSVLLAIVGAVLPSALKKGEP